MAMCIYAPVWRLRTNYVFISEFAKNSQLSTNSKVVAYGYFLDGKDDEITIDKVNNSKVTGTNVSGSNLTNVDGQSVNAGAWFKYTLKDGKYNLTATNKSKGNDNVGTNVTVVNYDSKGVTINYGSRHHQGQCFHRVCGPQGQRRCEGLHRHQERARYCIPRFHQ